MKIDLTKANSIKDFIDLAHRLNLNPTKAKVATLIMYSTLWMLRKNRNSWIFEKRDTTLTI